MTVSEIIITGGVQLVSGGLIWLYKDKKKSDAEVLITILNTLKEENQRLSESNKELMAMVKTEKEEKSEETKKKEDCQKTVHQMEILDQKKSNEITLLRLKNPDSNY